MSPWVYDNIYYLFNKRYNNKKITICASNYLDASIANQETLTQRVGERVRSRLYEMTDAHQLDGSDFRKKYG
jgi:DNA replication protein DnaC